MSTKQKWLVVESQYGECSIDLDGDETPYKGSKWTYWWSDEMTIDEAEKMLEEIDFEQNMLERFDKIRRDVREAANENFIRHGGPIATKYDCRDEIIALVMRTLHESNATQKMMIDFLTSHRVVRKLDDIYRCR